MFWRLGFAHTSPIETLLEGDDYTLQQLLDEEDLVQECKQLNKKLVDFLGLPEQVRVLVDYLVMEPSADADDKTKFVYPYKASEVLSLDLTPVYDTLFASEELITKLLDFLRSQKPSSLNLLLTGYFCKVVMSMLARRPVETLNAIERAGTVDLMMLHLGSYSILELLLKTVGEAEEGQNGTTWDGWLDELNVVGGLVNKFNPELDEDVHENASGALVALLSQQGLGAPWVSTAPSPRAKRVCKELLAPETVEILLDRTLFGSSTTMDHGLSVVVELVRHCSMESVEEEAPCTPPASDGGFGFGRTVSSSENLKPTLSTASMQADMSSGLSPVLEVVARRLESFVDVLKHPPTNVNRVVNQAGVLDPPLGAARLKVLDMMSVMLMLGNTDLERKIVQLQVLPAILGLFFEYPWHNLMHNLVWRIFEAVLKPDDGPFLLRRALIEDGDLLRRVADAFVANDAHVAAGGSRKGNMGHLRSMANAVMRLARDNEGLAAKCRAPFWLAFLEQYLDPLNAVIEKNSSMNASGSPSALDTTPEDAWLQGAGFSLTIPDGLNPEDIDEAWGEDGDVVMGDDDDDEICAVAVNAGMGPDDDEDVIEATPVAEPEFRRMLSSEEAEAALNAAVAGVRLTDRGVKVPDEMMAAATVGQSPPGSPPKHSSPTKSNIPKIVPVKRASPSGAQPVQPERATARTPLPPPPSAPVQPEKSTVRMALPPPPPCPEDLDPPAGVAPPAAPLPPPPAAPPVVAAAAVAPPSPPAAAPAAGGGKVSVDVKLELALNEMGVPVARVTVNAICA